MQRLLIVPNANIPQLITKKIEKQHLTNRLRIDALKFARVSAQTLAIRLDEKKMESCFEYLGCNEKDCPMHGRKDNKHCWEVEGTLCNHHGIQIVRAKFSSPKKHACALSYCIYYKEAQNRGIV